MERNEYTRTDLACEAGRPAEAETTETVRLGSTAEANVIRRREEGGGQYVTVSCGRLTELGECEARALSHAIAREMEQLAWQMLGHLPDPECRVLVVGLGNADMTPDAIGPITARSLTATRHLKAHDDALYRSLGCCELAAVAPGVLGQTGIETLELVRGAVEHVQPHLVVVVDALAARSCERLAATIQLSDRGIGPGSGIGNSRESIDRESLGCPVMAVGVPTVVDSSTLVYDALSQAGIRDEDIGEELRSVLENGRTFIVSPRDSDRITEITAQVLARAIDRAFGVEL